MDIEEGLRRVMQTAAAPGNPSRPDCGMPCSMNRGRGGQKTVTRETGLLHQGRPAMAKWHFVGVAASRHQLWRPVTEGNVQLLSTSFSAASIKCLASIGGLRFMVAPTIPGTSVVGGASRKRNSGLVIVPGASLSTRKQETADQCFACQSCRFSPGRRLGGAPQGADRTMAKRRSRRATVALIPSLVSGSSSVATNLANLVGRFT